MARRSRRASEEPFVPLYILKDALGFVTASHCSTKALNLEIDRASLQRPIRVWHWGTETHGITPYGRQPVLGWKLIEQFTVV